MGVEFFWSRNCAVCVHGGFDTGGRGRRERIAECFAANIQLAVVLHSVAVNGCPDIRAAGQTKVGGGKKAIFRQDNYGLHAKANGITARKITDGGRKLNSNEGQTL